jgi:uncharacterized PurR-regulated membrane protein YhhQ (DUF165 family)
MAEPRFVRRCMGVAAVAVYVGAIVGANYVTNHYGLIAVGFGLTATAGTYLAGCALMLRNLVQDALGRPVVFAAIVAGAALSALTSPALAVASGVAFGVSETLDMAVYTPLRRRGWARAVVPASLLGALVDTFVFLYLAHFPVTAAGVAGQLVGKTWAVWVPVVAVLIVRKAVRRGAVSSDPVGA